MLLQLSLVVLAAFVEGRGDRGEEVLRRPLEGRNDDGGKRILEGRLQNRLESGRKRLAHGVHGRF